MRWALCAIAALLAGCVSDPGSSVVVDGVELQPFVVRQLVADDGNTATFESVTVWMDPQEFWRAGYDPGEWR